MQCSFGTLLICCSAPFVSRFFIFSFCLTLYCFFFGLRICCSIGILFICFYCFIVIISCCIFVFLFTYMPLTFVEVHVCSAPDLCIFFLWILIKNTVRCRHILLLWKSLKIIYMWFFGFFFISPNELHLKIKLISKWMSYLYNIQIIMKIDIWCYSKHTKK